ncbi:probable inactive leucine-rich repeat receptor-like protein kinase At3g03770 [Vigna unguiculata]|uniref:probable inactive leucine-rich repeat receptor-like protein kinase At3g03770 n=1 Tax=Vigna unguiculata TaxID=3917 RepID=UPI001016938A|nr:probable inactive leucine-rich repeat receptor-like protein kinase At3g03770 [Vigna unguiculata]XP_027922380.1 probable inactive leucine-rich repeat receptor-like protein kinase At3g03770 [Vigna unguiculata]XP_027922381.1 probable inactive leucine-rich repeat receptor-like protein kinase At3g03770 [Vigna unguiculata]
MGNRVHLSVLLVLVTVLVSIFHSEQLSSHSQTLLRIQRLLNFPAVLSSWNNNTDFCSTDSTSSLTVVCYDGTITQLHIVGESRAPLLAKNFSINSFFTTLVRLPNLKVLTLVSLGIWGPLPGKIAHLSSLEIFNASSNFLYGSIPPEFSLLSHLQTLILDHNMFSGHLPEWFDSFPALTVLSLKHNLFNGSLPDSLSSLENMRILSLSHNHFYGPVPDLHRLTNLQVLELDDNGFGPRFPQLGDKLVTLVLRNNKFRSSIPDEMSSCYQLERLDISANTFVGPFQLALMSLPSITYLNISGNKLTGMLLENLSCNPGLQAVDLSSNLLTGILPKCLISNANDRTALYARNCLEETNQNQHALPFCHTEAIAVGVVPEGKKHKRVSKAVLSLGIVCGTFGGVAIIALLFFIIRRENVKRKTKNPPPTKLISENAASGYTSKLLSDARYISQTMKFGTVDLPPYRAFSLDEIVAATNNFDSACFMGEGSQGKMHRGQLKDGLLVAIRSVKVTKSFSTQDFVHYIEQIFKYRHRHLVSVLGHCIECYLDDSSVSSIFIVFEYIPNGTLKSWISDRHYKKSLTWTQRIEAAIGVAKGIQYLHTGIVPSVYSNNLKISDVLLDQNFVAKIKIYDPPLLSLMRKVGQGNPSRELKSPSTNKNVKQVDESDVYDFGVILLELILGRTIKSRNVDTLKDLLQASITADGEARRSIIDPEVRKVCLDQSLKTVMEICVRCLVKEPAERPSIEDVLWNLQFATQVQDAWVGDSQSSSDGSPISPLASIRMTFH